MFQRVTLALFIVGVASSSTWAGDTLHVPADYPTIQAAIVASNDGDTIVVAPGTYAQPIHFLGKSILITSTNPLSDAIVSTTRIASTISLFGTENAELRGFRIMTVLAHQAQLAISRCQIGTGIIDNNGRISDCRTICETCNALDAFENCDGPIERCVVCGYSVAFNHCDGEISNCLVTESSVGIGYSGSGIVRNCTIIGNLRGLASYNGEIRNSIIWNNWNNDISGPANVHWTCVQDLDNCTNPQFVDPGHWDFDGQIFWVEGTDYRLLPDSPLIDAGDPAVMFDPMEIDLDGNARVFNGRIDMGAYEAQDTGCDGDDFDGDGLKDECDPDSDGDGVVNPDDECGYTLPGADVDTEGRPRGDLNDDCRNDLADFAIFQRGLSGP